MWNSNSDIRELVQGDWISFSLWFGFFCLEKIHPNLLLYLLLFHVFLWIFSIYLQLKEFVFDHIKFYFQSRMLHSHFKNGDRIQKMVILICMFPCDLKFAKSFHVKINSYYVPLIESILKCSDLWATSSGEFLISFWVMCIVCHDFFINIQ
jgi:hypothetical protein